MSSLAFREEIERFLRPQQRVPPVIPGVHWLTSPNDSLNGGDFTASQAKSLAQTGVRDLIRRSNLRLRRLGYRIRNSTQEPVALFPAPRMQLLFVRWSGAQSVRPESITNISWGLVSDFAELDSENCVYAG